MSIIKKMQPQMVVLPTSIATAKLSPSAIVVYLAAASYTQHEGHAFKGDLIEATGLSANTLTKTIKELEKSGWVNVEHFWHDNAGQEFPTPTDASGAKLTRSRTRYTANLTPKAGN